MQKAEEEFCETIGRQELQWESEKIEFLKEVEELQIEVGQLEGRKRQALLPIEERERNSLEKEEELNKKEEALKLREEKFEEDVELLEVKLSEVAEREVEATKVSRSQAHAQNGINIQSELIKAQTAELNDKMAKYLADMQAKDSKLTLREQNVARKEEVLDNKVKMIMEKEASFDTRERQLRDKYATLEASVQEFKLKQQNG